MTLRKKTVLMRNCEEMVVLHPSKMLDDDQDLKNGWVKCWP